MKNDGSLQIATILESKRAPERYAYEIDVPEGSSLVPMEDSVVIKDAAGNFEGIFIPPWAKDSAGKKIPTHYEVEGNTLVQVVDHKSMANVSYPIVADPWLGRDLISWWSVSFAGRGYTLNVGPTQAGRGSNLPYMLWAHSSELRTKMGSNAHYFTDTIQQQFYCHVVGQKFSPGTYNMESWRPFVSWSLQLDPLDRCNPGGSGSS